jgi:hypothetical protein
VQRSMKISIACIAAALMASCGEKTASNVVAPGADESARTKVLEAGADLLQNKTPLRKLDAYLDGFHFYNGKMARSS